MIKVGNRRRDAVIDASARLWLIRNECFEGVGGRRFSELRLDKPDHPIVLDAWTLFHTIDAESPLHGSEEMVLRAVDASFLVAFRGTDEQTAQTVTAMREYAIAETVWNRRFKATPDLRRSRRKGSCLDFDLADVTANTAVRHASTLDAPMKPGGS